MGPKRRSSPGFLNTLETVVLGFSYRIIQWRDWSSDQSVHVTQPNLPLATSCCDKAITHRLLPHPLLPSLPVETQPSEGCWEVVGSRWQQREFPPAGDTSPQPWSNDTSLSLLTWRSRSPSPESALFSPFILSSMNTISERHRGKK